MPSPKRHRFGADYKDASSSDDGSARKGSNRPRGYRPEIQRENSLVKRQAEAEEAEAEEAEVEVEEKHDSGWDTDYDATDKYHLSDEEDPFDSYFSPRERSRPARDDDHGREWRTPSASPPRGDESDHGTSSRRRKEDRETRPHGHVRRRSSSRPRPRPRDGRDGDRHKSRHTPPSHAPPGPGSHAHRPRPRAPGEASSSHHHHHHHAHPPPRPQASRASSSLAAGPRPARPRPPRRGLSDKSVRTMPRSVQDLVRRLDPKSVEEVSRFWDNFPWQEAAKVAMQAGTVAAIKVGSDKMPWPVKGTKIASAALGAAVVDHVLKPKKKGGIKYAAMRHLTEVAVSNLIVGPAMGSASRHTGGRGGGRRK